MKKITIFTLTVFAFFTVLIFNVSATSLSVNAKADATEYKPGSTINITVSDMLNTDVHGVQIDINFNNEYLDYVSCTSKISSEWNFKLRKISEGKLRLLSYDNSATLVKPLSKSGDISVITFKVKTAVKSDRVNTVELKNGILTDKNGETITGVSYSNANFKVLKNTQKNNIVPVSKIILKENNCTLTVGKVKTVLATVKPSNATNKKIVWSTSDKRVVTVSSKGLISSIQVGTAIITAKLDGKTAKLTVRVNPAVPTKLSYKKSGSNVIFKFKKASGTNAQIFLKINKGKYKSVVKTSKSYFNCKLNKGKKYLIKIRTYKKVGKKYYYSSYSKTLSIKF